MPLLHSKILGKGRPFLILHGFLGMSDNWKTLGAKFSEQGFEVHLIDQRNHGKSFHSNHFDYSFLSEDLKQYTDHYGLRDVILLGHSMGGKTAMQFSCSYPTLIKKLIVADIAPKFYPPHHQYIVDALSALDLEQIASRSEADKALSIHIPEFGIRQFLLKNLYWVAQGKLGFRFHLEVLKNSMEEIGDTLGPMEHYDGETLFLRGDRSEYIANTDTALILKHFPKATVETVPNAGHWLHAENPLAFFIKAMDFLNR